MAMGLPQTGLLTGRFAACASVYTAVHIFKSQPAIPGYPDTQPFCTCERARVNGRARVPRPSY